MKTLASLSIFVVTVAMVATDATGQSVYRCGSTYSEKPCTDGVAVNVQDARTPAQKKESEAATRRDVGTAEALEKTKQREIAQSNKSSSELNKARNKAADAKTKTTAEDTTRTERNSKESNTGANPARKKKDSEYFTARSVASRPAPKTSASK